MKDIMDLHTHTIASGHAYNTINEMAEAASKKGLSLLGITEHAPALIGSCSSLYFHNLHVVPRELFGTKLMLGCELNILDNDGSVDLSDNILKKMDLVIASIHQPCYKCRSDIENNTNAVINAMKNPYIHIIGHPDDGRFPLDYDKVVKAAKEENVLLELNNSSVSPKGFRQNAKENIKVMLEYCKKYEAYIIMNSDAHIFTDIGNHEYVRDIIDEMMFPKELIVNHSIEALNMFISVK